MRARVSSCTSGDWLMTRDTVFFETLASRAMSLMVALRPGRMLDGLAAAGRGTAIGRGEVRGAFFRMRVMGGDCTEARDGAAVVPCPGETM